MKNIVWGLVGLALLAGCTRASQKGAADSGRIAITVTENGFEPATITVPAGKPVTLVVTRTTTKTCATELVMAAEGINQPLPLGQPVEITFTPDKPGELDYACAMDMYTGKIIVK
jgi:plastocyanin domain-containing protein